MSISKYIVFEDGVAVEFPLSESHQSVALQVGKTPISAGFINRFNGKIICSGESLTLKLRSNPGDIKFFKWHRVVVLFICLSGLLALQGCGAARKQVLPDTLYSVEWGKALNSEEVISYLFRHTPNSFLKPDPCWKSPSFFISHIQE